MVSVSKKAQEINNLLDTLYQVNNGGENYFLVRFSKNL